MPPRVNSPPSFPSGSLESESDDDDDDDDEEEEEDDDDVSPVQPEGEDRILDLALFDHRVEHRRDVGNGQLRITHSLAKDTVSLSSKSSSLQG